MTLRNLGFGAVPIHGQMSQPKRLGALNKFKSGERQILVSAAPGHAFLAHRCNTPLRANPYQSPCLVCPLPSSPSAYKTHHTHASI